MPNYRDIIDSEVDFTIFVAFHLPGVRPFGFELRVERLAPRCLVAVGNDIF